MVRIVGARAPQKRESPTAVSTTARPVARGGGAPHCGMTQPRPFVCQERVRWADVDLVGIMRFSAFTRLVELAEQELLRAAGMPYVEIFENPTFWMPRRHLSIDYLAPARIDEPLTLVSYVSRLGTTSMTMTVDIYADARRSLVASAAMVVVCVDRAHFHKQPLPAAMQAGLAPFVCSQEAARAWYAHGQEDSSAARLGDG